MFKSLIRFFASRKQLFKRIEELEEKYAKLQKTNDLLMDIKIIHPRSSNLQPQDSNKVWHLILNSVSNEETWIKPESISYISPIRDSSFTAIVDGCQLAFNFDSPAAALEVRNILLNIDKIPATNTYDETVEKADYFSAQTSSKKVTQEDVDSMIIKNRKKH